MAEKRIPELECVDTAIGERILEAGRPGLDPEMRHLLEAHLEVCAFCRQTVDLEQRLAAMIRAGSRRGARARGRGRRPLWAGAAALAAAAAAVFCMMTLAPRPVGPTVSIRGAESARFLRPVEGEVVTRDALSVNWTEVPGADSYELHLSEVDGPSSWTASTMGTRWEPCADVELSEGGSYRLVLATVPEDLSTPGSPSVRFRVGGSWDLVRHRMARAQPISYGLLVVGLLLGFYSIRARRWA